MFWPFISIISLFVSIVHKDHKSFNFIPQANLFSASQFSHKSHICCSSVLDWVSGFVCPLLWARVSSYWHPTFPHNKSGVHPTDIGRGSFRGQVWTNVTQNTWHWRTNPIISSCNSDQFVSKPHPKLKITGLHIQNNYILYISILCVWPVEE